MKRLIVGLAVAGLVAFAVMARLDGLNRGLWAAEAWVANSATAPNLSQVFYYDAWLQTTPPLFLLLVRGVVGVFGLSNASLRFVPLALGLAAVGFMALFSIRAFRPPFAFLCTSLLAFSPVAIAYSKELKQYSGDAAATAMLLLLLWRYRDRPDSRAYRLVLLGVAVALLLSYTAMMVLPLAFIVLAFTEPDGSSSLSPPRRKILRCAGFAFGAGLQCVVIYLAFIRPNLAANLAEFWQDGYPAGGSALQTAMYYLQHVVGQSFVSDYIPRTVDRAALLSILRIVPGSVLAVVAGLAATGIGALVWRYRSNRRRVWLAAFSGIPLLTLVGFNLAHRYPIDGRLTVFLLPCSAVAIALLLEALCEVAAVRRSAAWRESLAWLAAGTVAAAVVLGGWTDRHVILNEDAEGAMAYVQKAAGTGDLLYVHASIGELAKLYFRVLGWHPASVMFGDVGYSCCARKPDVVPGVTEMDRELSWLIAHRPGRRVWLLFTGREEPSPKLHRALAIDRLTAAGCRREASPSFSNVFLLRFTCGTGP